MGKDLPPQFLAALMGSGGGSGGAAKWGSITGDINSQADLIAKINSTLPDKVANKYLHTDLNNIVEWADITVGFANITGDVIDNAKLTTEFDKKMNVADGTLPLTVGRDDNGPYIEW